MRIAMRRRRVTDERGAFAVFFALMTVLLFTMGALAVDIGNAVSRKTSTQFQADYSALAGGRELGATPVAGAIPDPAVVDAVADYLNKNQPQDDDQPCWRDQNCVTSAHLTDGADANGEVRYTDDGLRVTAPESWVDFGLAETIGASGAHVSSTATVNLFTGGTRALPMYAFQGCDWGPQTIGSPPGGHLDPVVPTTLLYGAHDNATRLTAGSQVVKDSGGAVVNEIGFGTSGNTLTFKARQWDKTTHIVFFHENGVLIRSTTAFFEGSTAAGTPLSTPYTKNPETTVTLTVPDDVADTAGVWWVRVLNNPLPGEYSDPDEALPIAVGAAPLPCDGSASTGNFGMLVFPRENNQSTSDEISLNIIHGLQKPLTPSVHHWANDNDDSPDGLCTGGTNSAVFSTEGNPQPNTNCVDTETGDITNATTPGFITGMGGDPGLLQDKPTEDDCDPDGNSDERDIETGPNDSVSINNDTLSCFLIDDTRTLGSLATVGYDDGPAFYDTVYSSPRFVYVPVLEVQPSPGGSETYSIVDYRPGFITGETGLSTKNAPVFLSASEKENNGVIVDGGKIEQLKVFFFNYDALPKDGSFPVIPYLGVGDPILRLVD